MTTLSPKSSHKTISIVTPSYNQGEYLEKTIRSVISQQGDFYIDYIIMDGGSTDNSVDIIKKYADLVNEGNWGKNCLGIELTWLSENDAGQTDAINKGFRKARGEIVSYLNSDDMYFPGSFSTVLNHFSQNPDDDFVYGDGDVIDETGALQWEWLSRPYDLKLLKSYHFLWNDFTNYIMQQATFWRRGVFDKIGMLDDSFHYVMDIEYWIRAGANGLRLTHIPQKLGKFRMISGTKSLSSEVVFWPENLEIFRRYNGARAMKPFFTYFFFNKGLSKEFHTEHILSQNGLVLERWHELSKGEQEVLRNRAKKASYIACLRLSNVAFLRGEVKKACSLLKSAISHNRLLILHPLSILFLLKLLIGRNVSAALSKLRFMLIQQYRNRKYLYRYFYKGRS
jgi:glycosyltransferase involved in cell wall biosynthesis